MTHHSFAALLAMWTAMMAVMMAPLVWRWVALFATLSGGGGATFAAGYAAAWLPYSAAAAAVQWWLPHTTHAIAPAPAGPIAACVLIGAGLFQFAPLKRACLRHCRNPLTYFLTTWRNGPPNGFRIGARHGVYCVACCWALMATMLVTGLMSVTWMALLTAVGALEQLAPRGQRIAHVVGAALVAYGVVILLR